MRKENEDRLITDEVLGLYGVADGVGGLPHGSLAAEWALEQFQACIPSPATGLDAEALKETVCAVNRLIYTEGQKLNPGFGIGTTLTLGLLNRYTLKILHVGDSRCYVWRKGVLTQATIDHTIESDPRFAVRRREKPDLWAGQKGALTRCLGQPDPLEVEFHRLDLLEGDRVLFCTDGLFRHSDEEELCIELGKRSSPEFTLENLIAVANKRGGSDNSTGVLLFL